MKPMLFWNFLAFSMIIWMLAIWSPIPLPFLNPACISGSSQFTYCWKILTTTLSSVQLLSRVQLFGTPWIAARQASLSITNSKSLLKLMSILLLMPSNHLILCGPLLLPPSVFSSIRVFSIELVLRIRWPKHWGFSFSIRPSSELAVVHSKSSVNVIHLFFCILQTRNLRLREAT